LSRHLACGGAARAASARDNEDSVGATALIWAAIRGHLGIAQRLIDAGAEVDFATSNVRDTIAPP
jgi:ankyrin repeat protein